MATRGRFPARSRRQTDWIGGSSGQAFTTLATTDSVIQLSFDTRTAGQRPAAPFTITRCRGSLHVVPGAMSADTTGVGALGACVVSGEAFDAGIASIPTPWTESGDDRWFYHTYWSLAGRFDTAPVWSVPMIDIDSKAMRKVESGDVIVWVVENFISGVSLNVFLNQRTLVKVH